jgi:hypothetical protein
LVRCVSVSLALGAVCVCVACPWCGVCLCRLPHLMRARVVLKERIKAEAAADTARIADLRAANDAAAEAVRATHSDPTHTAWWVARGSVLMVGCTG